MLRAVFGGIAAAALVACGGGGSSDSPATPAQSPLAFPVEASLSKIVTTAGNYGGSYTDSNGTFALSLTITPGGLAKLKSTSPESKTYSTTVVLRKNGAIVSSAATTTYFTTGPLAIVGAWAGPDPTETTQRTALPGTATVGTSGPFFVAKKYPGGLTLLPHDVTGTWSLEQDTASTAFLCLTITEVSFVTATESDCFKIDAAGSVLGFRATTTSDARSTGTNRIVDTAVFR